MWLCVMFQCCVTSLYTHVIYLLHNCSLLLVNNLWFSCTCVLVWENVMLTFGSVDYPHIHGWMFMPIMDNICAMKKTKQSRYVQNTYKYSRDSPEGKTYNSESTQKDTLACVYISKLSTKMYKLYHFNIILSRHQNVTCNQIHFKFTYPAVPH